MGISTVEKSGMIYECENNDDYGTRTGSPVFVQALRCEEFSVTRRLACCSSIGGGKNSLRNLWVHQAWLVRSQATLGRDLACGDYRIYLDIEIRRIDCPRCMKVKQEKLDWLADNPFYSKRFGFFVGRRCRAMTIKDVAQETHLDWKTIKELDKQYMREQLRRIGVPTPKVIGVDEISIRKGHTYRIVVSDLLRRRPIWFGGKDRSEQSMDEFFTWLGPKKSQQIRLAVMDMWKAFRKSTLKPEHAPQAAILFDKFHILRHLGDALDQVRKSEYGRLVGKSRRLIKGQKYTLLSHRENLTTEGRRSLRLLLKANKRLNTAYVLKETFGQLWDPLMPG